MSSTSRYHLFASVLVRIFRVDQATPESVAKELGYQSPFFVYGWCEGRHLPSLTRLVDLANVLGWPLDELLTAWCADQAPDHTIRFKIITAQLLGLQAAEDLFSGKHEVDDDIWLNRPAPPMTAAEVCLELDHVPLGSYRDNRRPGRPKS